MADLFSNLPARPSPKHNVGFGNAMFLCDLADNVPIETMRAKARNGEYPDLNPAYARAWRKLFGRQS